MHPEVVFLKGRNELGERRIIDIIQSRLDLMPRMVIPFGDDVSAYDIGNGNIAVLKTDMLVGKTDVPPGMSFWQAARKAVVMNISDFAAKGVEPKVVLVSLGLSRAMNEKDVEEIGDGLNVGAREYGAYVIGGDTGEASDLVISVSLFGLARSTDVMLRSGAKPGDVVAVTGFFGKSASGLKILTERLELKSHMEKQLAESVLMPKARLKEGLALVQTRAVTAAIDSSDGLAWSLHEIAKSSRVGFLVNKLPVAEEVRSFAEDRGLDPLELTLYGGEEYEIVFTVKRDLWKKAERAVESVGGKLLAIGEATEDRRVFLEIDNKRCTIEPRGYEHFKT
jgi:thiamine-monophosphate kinase